MIIEFETQKGITIIGYFPDQIAIAADAKIAIQSILDNINEKSEASANIIQEKSYNDPFEKMILDELTAARAEVGFTPHEIVNEYRKNQLDQHNRSNEDEFFHVKWDIDFFDVKAGELIEKLDIYLEPSERGNKNPIFESKNKFNSFNKVSKKIVYNNSRNQRVRYNRKILN